MRGRTPRRDVSDSPDTPRSPGDVDSDDSAGAAPRAGVPDLGEACALGARLGGGGGGEVYEGRTTIALGPHGRRELPCAVKLVYESQAGDPEVARRFIREAMLGHRAGVHPNVVAARALGVAADGRLYMVMDHAGVPLRDLVERLVGDHPVIRAVAEGVLAALRRLHECGVAHGDVNAGNVLLGRDGGVRLCDLGKARDLAGSDGDRARRADLRKLGLIVHELVSGELALDGRRVRPLPASVPADLRDLVARLLGPGERDRAAASAEADESDRAGDLQPDELSLLLRLRSAAIAPADVIAARVAEAERAGIPDVDAMDRDQLLAALRARVGRMSASRTDGEAGAAGPPPSARDSSAATTAAMLASDPPVAPVATTPAVAVPAASERIHGAAVAETRPRRLALWGAAGIGALFVTQLLAAVIARHLEPSAAPSQPADSSAASAEPAPAPSPPDATDAPIAVSADRDPYVLGDSSPARPVSSDDDRRVRRPAPSPTGPARVARPVYEDEPADRGTEARAHYKRRRSRLASGLDDEMGRFEFGQWAERAGVVLRVGDGQWLEQSALVRLLVENRGDTRYRLSDIYIVFPGSGRPVGVQIALVDGQPPPVRSSDDQRLIANIPTGHEVEIIVRVVDAHRLAGRAVTLGITEPGGERGVAVRKLYWP